MDTDTDPDMTCQSRAGQGTTARRTGKYRQSRGTGKGDASCNILCRSGNEVIVVLNKITKATNEGQRASAQADGLTFSSAVAAVARIRMRMRGAEVLKPQPHLFSHDYPIEQKPLLRELFWARRAVSSQQPARAEQ
jgi:hypothetical protein